MLLLHMAIAHNLKISSKTYSVRGKTEVLNPNSCFFYLFFAPILFFLTIDPKTFFKNFPKEWTYIQLINNKRTYNQSITKLNVRTSNLYWPSNCWLSHKFIALKILLTLTLKLWHSVYYAYNKWKMKFLYRILKFDLNFCLWYALYIFTFLSTFSPS